MKALVIMIAILAIFFSFGSKVSAYFKKDSKQAIIEEKASAKFCADVVTPEVVHLGERRSEDSSTAVIKGWGLDYAKRQWALYKGRFWLQGQRYDEGLCVKADDQGVFVLSAGKVVKL